MDTMMDKVGYEFLRDNRPQLCQQFEKYPTYSLGEICTFSEA